MNNKNQNDFENVSVTSCPSSPVKSRPSLFQTLAQVKEQVEYESFGEVNKRTGRIMIDPLIDELCLIIAEVLVRPPESKMRIRGMEIETAIVQEVYRALKNGHIEMVYNNFRAQTQIIHNKSAYLQTALYNAVFEYNAHYTNLVAHDWY